MTLLTMENVERVALGAAKEWLLPRLKEHHRQGRTLHALLAFGPLVQHASAEELDLLEVVSPLAQATTADVTSEIKLDRRFLGRVTLVSMSPEGFNAAIQASAPLVIHVLGAFKALYDASGLERRLVTARRRLLTA